MIELLLQADRLLTVDMVDQADAIYRRVAESDPGNAIAVVGMARCALARADDHGAYRFAAQALTIDPQNEMARRMEARLREVLTARGETPGAGRAEVPAVPEPTSAPAAAPVVPTPAAPAPPAPTPAAPAAAPVVPTTAAPAPARRSFLDRVRGR